PFWFSVAGCPSLTLRRRDQPGNITTSTPGHQPRHETNAGVGPEALTGDDFYEGHTIPSCVHCNLRGRAAAVPQSSPRRYDRVERDLDLDRLVALALAGLTGSAFTLAFADRIAGVAFTLADALALVVAVDEPRDVDLRHRDRHGLFALARDHVSARHVTAQVL